MFKRKIEKEFKKWKESLSLKRTALVVKGIRQCGKTTSILEFSKENYKKVIYIDFKENKIARLAFEGNLNSNEILLSLSSQVSDFDIVENKTVIIFDEIQECANCRKSLKYLLEDKRFDIICSGSMLGISGYNKKNKGIPTGFETIIEMKSMDFEEFLWSQDVHITLIESIKNSYNNLLKINEAIHKSFLGLFKIYMCVGGMPESILIYNKTKDIKEAFKKNKMLLEEYKGDFGKFLNEKEEESINGPFYSKIMKIYNSIPSQLSKINNKFSYNAISKYANSRDYFPAIEYLNEFGLISFSYNLKKLEYPFNAFKDENSFKLYVNDTGLFIAMFDEEIIKYIFNDELKIFKGPIFENLIAESLFKNNKSLYYFSKSSGLEIDFIILLNEKVIPLEVKAKSGRAKSLKTVVESKKIYNIEKGLKLSENNISVSNDIINLPYYLIFLLTNN